MSDGPLLSFRNPWFAWSVGTVLAMAAAALLIGFVWLPSVHADVSAGGLWSTICRAAGLADRWLVAPRDPPTEGQDADVAPAPPAAA
jgi:hypothetical protein